MRDCDIDLFVALGTVSVLACFALGFALAAVDQEYILVLDQPEALLSIGVVQAGLTKAQAEGVAFQMNEAFKGRSIPVVVRAERQRDIGNYHPKR